MPRISILKKGLETWYVLVIPALGRQKKEDTWDSLVSQLDLIDEFQAREETLTQK